MSRFNLFVSNFLVYGLGGVISKIIPFIMLPVITRLMPDTTYFGLNDISTIVVSFASALAVMGMYDAMFRMFFDREEEEYKKSICSSALAFTICTSLVIFFILFIFQELFSKIFFSSSKYVNLMTLSAISALIGSTNSIVSAPTRINNNRKVFLATNTISPIISYGISIPLLVKGWYVAALPLAAIVSALTMEVVFLIVNKKWFSFKLVKISYIKQMLKIAIPLMPNFLIYWVFNSSDKLMIAKILGNDAAGIYAIGSKIGQVSQLIYTAFAGGWQFFAFSTMKDDDQVGLTSNVFEYLGSITFIAGILMTVFSKFIFNVLFTGDYLKGYIVAPYLFMAPLLLMLFQIGTNQFLVIKKTWPNFFILLFGAILNITLNFVLIPKIGIEGASIATLIGYITSVVICVIVLQRMKLLHLSGKFLFVVVISIAYMITWRIILMEHFAWNIIVAVFVSATILLQFSGDVKKLLKK